MKNNKNDYYRILKKNVAFGKLNSIHYSHSGDMNGNVYEIYINVLDGLVKESKKDYYSEPLLIKEYSVSEEEIKKLIDYINKYNLPLWKDIPSSGEYALDASVSYLSFSYENNQKLESYSFDFNLALPEEGYRILKDLTKMMNSLLAEEKLIKEYYETTS